MDLKDYLRVVRRRVLEFFIVLIVVIMGWAYMWAQEEQFFMASTSLVVGAVDYDKSADNKMEFIRNISDLRDQMTGSINRTEFSKEIAKIIYENMVYAVKTAKKKVENVKGDDLARFHPVFTPGSETPSINKSFNNHVNAYEFLRERFAQEGKDADQADTYTTYIKNCCLQVQLLGEDKATSSIHLMVKTINKDLSIVVVNEYAYRNARHFNRKQSTLLEQRASDISVYHKSGQEAHNDMMERFYNQISQEYYQPYIERVLDNDMDGASNWRARLLASLNNKSDNQALGSKLGNLSELQWKLSLDNFDPEKDIFDHVYSVDELRKLERELFKLKTRYDFIRSYKGGNERYVNRDDIERKLEGIRSRIEGHQDFITQKQEERRLLEMRMNQLSDYERRLLKKQSGQFQAYRDQIYQEETKLSELLSKYTDEHPAVIAQKNNINHLKELRQKMEEDTEDVDLIQHEFKMKEIETFIEFRREEIENLKEDEVDYLEQLSRLNDRELTVRDIETERTEVRKQMSGLRKELNNIRRDLTLNQIVSVGSPALDSSKVQKQYTFNKTFVLMILVGIIISIFWVYMHEYLDTTIKTEHDVRRHMNLPVLAMVSRARKEVVLTELPNKDPFAERFNTAATLVRSAAQDLDLKSFLVTSTVPQEGKTTICVDLAIALARKGLRVIVVDCDLRIPTIHEVLEIDNTQGLSTLLEGAQDPASSINQYLKSTSVDNLRVMTSGPIPADPINLLESVRMKTLLEGLKEECDYLIIDTPPIYNVGDTLTIAGMVDATLFVVGAERVQQEQVTWAKHLLTNVNANILGVFLNMVRVPGKSYYYYYNGYKSYRSRG